MTAGKLRPRNHRDAGGGEGEVSDWLRERARFKAPEGWRTPRRIALFVRRQNSHQRPGVRRPSAAVRALLVLLLFLTG